MKRILSIFLVLTMLTSTLADLSATEQETVEPQVVETEVQTTVEETQTDVEEGEVQTTVEETQTDVEEGEVQATVEETQTDVEEEAVENETENASLSFRDSYTDERIIITGELNPTKESVLKYLITKETYSKTTLTAIDSDGTDISDQIYIKDTNFDETSTVSNDYMFELAVKGSNGVEVTIKDEFRVVIGNYPNIIRMANGFGNSSTSGSGFSEPALYYEYGQKPEKNLNDLMFNGAYVEDEEDVKVYPENVYVEYIGSELVGMKQAEYGYTDSEYSNATFNTYNRDVEFKGDGTDLPGVYHFFVTLENIVDSHNNVAEYGYAVITIEVKNYDGTNTFYGAVNNSGLYFDTDFTTEERAKWLGNYVTTDEVAQYMSGKLSELDLKALINSRTKPYTGTPIGNYDGKGYNVDTDSETENEVDTTVEITPTDKQKLNETGYSAYLVLVIVGLISILSVFRRYIK